MDLGRFIKQKREARNWSQPDLAAKTGLSTVYISELENNKRKQVSYDVVRKILIALGVTDLDKYLIGTDNPYQQDRELIKKCIRYADEILTDIPFEKKAEAILDVYDEILQDRSQEKNIKKIYHTIKKYAAA